MSLTKDEAAPHRRQRAAVCSARRIENVSAQWGRGTSIAATCTLFGRVAFLGEHTLENYLDEIAVPALRVAADDQKRGVLGREQFLELSETIAEYLQLVQETLEYRREQQTTTVPATPGAVPRSVLVLAGRGSLDLAATQLIAEASASISALLPAVRRSVA